MHRAISCLILGATMLSMNAHGTDVKNALNGREIKQLVSGNTVEGHFVKPRENKEFLTTSVRFRAYFSPDGDVIEKSSAPAAGSGAGHVAAHGAWSVTKGKLCVQFRDAKDNRKKCRRIVPTDAGKHELYTGKGKLYRTWDRILPGNVHELD